MAFSNTCFLGFIRLWPWEVDDTPADWTLEVAREVLSLDDYRMACRLMESAPFRSRFLSVRCIALFASLSGGLNSEASVQKLADYPYLSSLRNAARRH